MNGIIKEVCQQEDLLFIEEINEGWSADMKYRAKLKNGQTVLVKVSKYSLSENKLLAYETLNALDDFAYPVSKVIKYGTLPKVCCYLIFTWIEGCPISEKLPNLLKSTQYGLGFESGRYLHKLHSTTVNPNLKPWATKFNKKIDRKIKMYQDCPMKVKNASKIIDYINENRYLLEERPQCFQHGDFHTGNMILTPTNNIGIIDFDRLDYGDPWEEFNRIVWSANLSPDFATGQIQGYFNGQVPEIFFKLLPLYIGSNQLSSIPWALNFGEKEVKTALAQFEEQLDIFENFTNYVPKWYNPK